MASITVPLFPLPGVVLFPGVRMPFYVFEPRYRAMLSEVLDSHGLIGLPTLLGEGEGPAEGRPPIAGIFGVGHVGDYKTHADGTSHILVSGAHRVRLERELPSEPFRRAEVRLLADQPATEQRSRELRGRLRARIAELVRLGMNDEARGALEEILEDDDRELAFVVNLLATVVVGNPQVRLNLLEVDDVGLRAQHLLNILSTQSQMWSPGYRGPDDSAEENPT
jgi:Lon protease-like protein